MPQELEASPRDDVQVRDRLPLLEEGLRSGRAFDRACRIERFDLFNRESAEQIAVSGRGSLTLPPGLDGAVSQENVSGSAPLAAVKELTIGRNVVRRSSYCYPPESPRGRTR
jgi:hypothetical protein